MWLMSHQGALCWLIQSTQYVPFMGLMELDKTTIGYSLTEKPKSEEAQETERGQGFLFGSYAVLSVTKKRKTTMNAFVSRPPLLAHAPCFLPTRPSHLSAPPRRHCLSE